MQVRSIDNSTRFYGANNLIQKIFKGALKDNTEVAVRVTLNNENVVQRLEAYELRNNTIVGGLGMGSKKGVNAVDIARLLARLQTKAKEGVDFIEEFAKASGR